MCLPVNDLVRFLSCWSLCLPVVKSEQKWDGLSLGTLGCKCSPVSFLPFTYSHPTWA